MVRLSRCGRSARDRQSRSIALASRFRRLFLLQTIRLSDRHRRSTRSSRQFCIVSTKTAIFWRRYNIGCIRAYAYTASGYIASVFDSLCLNIPHVHFRFENGTIDYYGIAALTHGFDDLLAYGKSVT